MSVTLSSKSGEVGEDSVNLMATDNRSMYGCRSKISVWIGVAAVCLAFFLLIWILGVVAHNSSAIGHWDSKCENLINRLTIDKEALRAERDQLNMNSRNLTRDLQVLQNQYNAMAASRDKLQEEVNRLNASRENKPCQQGWRSFRNKCYYFSPNGVTKTWERSRTDCKQRGADLVIITSKEELDFVTTAYGVTWIGLSDKEQENRWMWVDDTELVGNEFWQAGEPNNIDGIENCAEVSRSAKKFNDVSCDGKFSWACEN